MCAEEENGRGYFTSSGTRLAVDLIAEEERVGVVDTSVSSHRHYSKVLSGLRKRVLKRWKLTKMLPTMKRRPVPRQDMTYMMCEYRMRLVQCMRKFGKSKAPRQIRPKCLAVGKPVRR